MVELIAWVKPLKVDRDASTFLYVGLFFLQRVTICSHSSSIHFVHVSLKCQQTNCKFVHLLNISLG